MYRFLWFSVFGLLLLAGYSAGCTGGIPPEQAKELEAVQVKEYQGEKLSSITDFRENSIAGPQYVKPDDYMLKVGGLVEKPASYTYTEVLSGFQSYQKVVGLDCVEGWSVKILWEGIRIKDIVEKAGVLPAARVIIFHAYDGYTTALPLSYISDNNLLLAYKMNGVVLPPERGFPFQLVAENKWGYKWIKWVTGLELSDDINYLGYWERAGYSNDASINYPFYER